MYEVWAMYVNFVQKVIAAPRFAKSATDKEQF
jgi:hypothetical protein